MDNIFYSNCLIECIKAKIRYKKNIKILHVISHDGLHHFMWLNKIDNNIYDFQQLEMAKHWIDLLWYKGKIRIRPYEVFIEWNIKNKGIYQ